MNVYLRARSAICQARRAQGFVMSRDKCQPIGQWALSAADSWVDGEGGAGLGGEGGIKLSASVCVCVCLCVCGTDTVKMMQGITDFACV